MPTLMDSLRKEQYKLDAKIQLMIIGLVMATVAVGRPKKNVKEIFGTERLPEIHF